MIANLKLFIEIARLVVWALRFIDDQIDEFEFKAKVKERKKIYDDFKEADRMERLRILRDRSK